MKKIRKSISIITVSALMMVFGGSAIVRGDDSPEELYQKAAQLSAAGQWAEAAATYERFIEKSGGKERLFEDFGSEAGGFFFDYGNALVNLGRWADAKEAFTTCVESDEMAKFVQTPVKTKNPRIQLGMFMLAHCEAQLGNHEEALKLYEDYIASEPDPEELAKVYGLYRLRYGGVLLKLGRQEEGIASIQELFDKKDERKIAPVFLVEGLLELGKWWVSQVEESNQDPAKIEEISKSANEFLDRNAPAMALSPMNKYRYGFYDRLKSLGADSIRAGLYPFALRIFSMMPTLQDVKEDIDLELAKQPIGGGVAPAFQHLIDQVEVKSQAEFHPDGETLSLLAIAFDRMGNKRAARALYWQLAEQYPELEEKRRSEMIHEASRLSTALGDFPTVEYFGNKFRGLSDAENRLKDNVDSFLLQSLFKAKKYDEVMSTAEKVRSQFEMGDPKRELADFYYAMTLFSTKRNEEAAEPLEEYLKHYPDGQGRELFSYFRITNALVLNKMRVAATYAEEFIKNYPDSKRYLDKAISDLCVARFNLEDYAGAIAAADQLQASRPESTGLGRILNLKGDALLIQASQMRERSQVEDRAAKGQQAIEAYLAAAVSAKSAIESESNREDFHRNVAAEAIWKSANQYYEGGEIEKGIAQYDSFFPDFEGTRWEPQISVFSLEHLEAQERGEEALKQVEKMILYLGNKPPKEQDVTLLRQAIGSFSEASVRIRGIEPTLAVLNEFPGVDPSNQALLTWLKIQQVIVLQESKKGLTKDSPEYAAIETKIAGVFEEMKQFDIKGLSEFALSEIGKYFSSSDNPFLGVPYFEELLERSSADSAQYKARAEMELGLIGMRSADPGQVQAAKARFERIATLYKDDVAILAEANLNLAKLYLNNKEWDNAIKVLGDINKNRSWFKKDRAKRAEASFLYGVAFDGKGDYEAASKNYVLMIGAFQAYPSWCAQAWERHLVNTFRDIEAMSTATEEEAALKRARELATYGLTRKYLYQWQNIPNEDDPSGALGRLRRDVDVMKAELQITPEEEHQQLYKHGLVQPK